MRVFCRAHEETHALHYLGKLSQLEAVLRRMRTTRQLLYEKNEQGIADIGGFYALQAPHNHVDMMGQMATYLSCFLNFVAIINAYRARS